MSVAQRRERSLKRWRRAWKIALIEKDNPDWRDLYDEIARQIRMSRRTVEKDLARAINVLAVNNLPPP